LLSRQCFDVVNSATQQGVAPGADYERKSAAADWHAECTTTDLGISESASDSRTKRMDNFADIPVVVEAHFEDRMMDLRDVLALKPGMVIPLTRPAGETLRVYVGDAFLASAEVIVIEDHLALRITEFEAQT
jgi:flagellar motor switch protein FliN